MQPQQAEASLTFDQRYLNRLLLLFVGLMFTVFYVETMLTPTLPSITSEFHISIAQASLLISLYAMSGTALVPVIGKLGDIYGKKRILVYVLFIFAASVSVTSFSPDYAFMLAARIIQGIGIAIVPLVFSLVREEFPEGQDSKGRGASQGDERRWLGRGTSARFPRFKLLRMAGNLPHGDTIGCTPRCPDLRGRSGVSV